MRINLVTPFAEKEAVKALGARWDATKKIWYIADVADLTPFLRWIPNLAAATEDATDGATRPTKSSPKASINQFKGPTTGATSEVPHCGCDVLPWEDCEHTTKTWPSNPFRNSLTLQPSCGQPFTSANSRNCRKIIDDGI